MKRQLLRKRRTHLGGMYDEHEPDSSELVILTEREQSYLLELLKRDAVQEEDAELVLTLMREHSPDLMESIPSLVEGFPGLAKRIYYFCRDIADVTGLVDVLIRLVKSERKITEFQLFWFAKMAEDYLMTGPNVAGLLHALYEHDNATDITKAKILEMPEKRFGLPELREEQLRSGHSDWLAWTAAIGCRESAKGQRNQLLKYFRRASPMNRLIGEFVEQCF